MLAWEGEGTALPLGFDVLRLETNWLYCGVDERLSRAGSEAESSQDPVQLLCRTLRLAPASYQRFELKEASPDRMLEVHSTINLSCADSSQSHSGTANFQSIAQLAAAMQRFASIEELDVCFASDVQTIVVHRVSP